MSKKLKFIAFVLFAAIAVSMIGLTACEGTAGKDGAAGAPGKSAYDIWLEQGNTGTEQDFLDSLKGEKGDQGLQGDPGETPEITVGSDGYWYVDGKNTGVKAQGDPGAAGKNGPSWFSGAKCPNESKDISQYAQGAKVGDFYICADCGTLWKNGGGIWDKICCLKGPKGDKGDPGESGGDPGFTLNVAAGQKADMPIALSAGTYVVEVVLSQKILTGRLEASVESSAANYSSAFAINKSKTIAAGNDSMDGTATHVYYGYVIVAEGDLKLTFAPTADLKMYDNATAIKDAKVTITKWEQQTLKADGTPVEIIISGSNATADTAFKVPVDSSVTAGTYTLTIDKVKLDSQDSTGVYDQTDSLIYGGQLVYLMPSATTTQWTISALKNQWLVFKPVIEGSARHVINPATVTLVRNEEA